MRAPETPATKRTLRVPANRQAKGAPAENSDSRLDSNLKTGKLNSSGATPGAMAPAPSVPIKRYDPTLPPLGPKGDPIVEMTVREVPIRIDSDTVVAGWT